MNEWLVKRWRDFTCSRMGRALKRFYQWWVGTWYDGPKAPERLHQAVKAFAVYYPDATVGEWIAFASRHSDECYRSGYARGYEWTEREYSTEPSEFDLHVNAGHDFTWIDLNPTEEQQRAIVQQDPVEQMTVEDQLRHLQHLGKVNGFRVVGVRKERKL